MLREQILKYIRKEWMKVAEQADNHPVMGTPPNEITIFEFSDADILKARCNGICTAVESVGRDGKSSAPIDDDPRKLVTKFHKAYWEHAQARFHVNTELNQAVVELVYGPRYGRGYWFEVRHGLPMGSAAWIS